MSIPQEAADHMLKQSYSLGLDKANNHIAQDRSDGVEALVGGTDVAETSVIKQDLLHDENCHRFGQFTTCLHDP